MQEMHSNEQIATATRHKNVWQPQQIKKMCGSKQNCHSRRGPFKPQWQSATHNYNSIGQSPSASAMLRVIYCAFFLFCSLCVVHAMLLFGPQDNAGTKAKVIDTFTVVQKGHKCFHLVMHMVVCGPV